MIHRRYGIYDRWLMGLPSSIAMLVMFPTLWALGVREDWAIGIIFVVVMITSTWGWLWVRRRKYPPEVVKRAQ